MIIYEINSRRVSEEEWNAHLRDILAGIQLDPIALELISEENDPESATR